MSRSNVPTRWPNGLTNVTPAELLRRFPQPFPYRRISQWGTDFDRYRAADWVVTVVGTGTAALANVVGGDLLLTTSATANDSVFLDKVGETYQFVDGLQLWYRSRFSVADATNTEIINGLQITDTTPTAVSDGIYFHKPSAGTRLYLVQVSAATGATTTTDTGVDLVNGQYIDVGFYFDGGAPAGGTSGAEAYTIYYEIKDNTGAVIGEGSAVANLPTVTQTISFGVLASTAAAQTMNVDYVWAAQEISGRE